MKAGETVDPNASQKRDRGWRATSKIELEAHVMIAPQKINFHIDTSIPDVYLAEFVDFDSERSTALTVRFISGLLGGAYKGMRKIGSGALAVILLVTGAF